MKLLRAAILLAITVAPAFHSASANTTCYYDSQLRLWVCHSNGGPPVRSR